MDLITFAIVVASLELVIGLALLFSPVRAMDGVCEIFENTALVSVIMFGFFALSVTAVLRDGDFDGGIRELVTWLALLTCLKALLYIWFPEKMRRMQDCFLRRDRPLWTRCSAVLMLSFGGFLSWTAYEMLQL